MELNPDTPLHLIDGPALLRSDVTAILGLLLGLDRALQGHPAGILERRWLDPQDRKE